MTEDAEHRKKLTRTDVEEWKRDEVILGSFIDWLNLKSLEIVPRSENEPWKVQSQCRGQKSRRHSFYFLGDLVT